jgi:hypothetical protein
MSETMPSENLNQTGWLTPAVVPDAYHDVGKLVAAARAARGRLVSFRWHFSEADLRSLQRAAYEWGSATAGRYRAFDARLLQAVKAALEDERSPYTLPIPPRPSLPDCIVTCTRDGEHYVIAGQAPFDIVFGYGSAGVPGGPAAARYLTDSARAVLAKSVADLGWNLETLHEPAFKPALNALYGMPLGYGVPENAAAVGEATMLELHFHGPFALMKGLGVPCVFDEPTARQGGVYLWTVPGGGAKERPWYVGQTQRSFALRLAEHVSCFLSGQYTVYEPACLVRGEHRLAERAVPVRWPDTLPDFLAHADVLVPKVREVLRIMRVHLAPMTADARLLNRVEGSIARYYQQHEDQDLKQFFAPGIRVPAAIPYDIPLLLAISTDGPIAGMPPEMPA